MRHFQAEVFDGVICPERSMRMKSGKNQHSALGSSGRGMSSVLGNDGPLPFYVDVSEIKG